MNFKNIVDVVMRASAAEQTEVVVSSHDDSLTRFANNCIHQNVTERNTQVVVRAVTGHRIGMAISNKTGRADLEALARRALELARLSPENPEFKSLPSPRPITTNASFDPHTAECSPDVRAAKAAVVCLKAAGARFTAAGSVRTVASRLGVANSLGVFAESSLSIADASMVIMGPDSSGWAQSSNSRIDKIDVESLADEAIRKAKIGANPLDASPGEYPVVLDPYATADVISMLAFDGMGATSFQEERSWLNGRIGKRVMSDSVAICDDATSASGIPNPFDYEGMPRQRCVIVDSGVPKTAVYDSFTAGRESNRESTGHATPPSPSERMGPLPMNLFLQTGNSSVEEMICSTKHGLYITRFWYTRPVHPRDAVITGMTRDGTFLIKNGEIAHPVKSLRFTQSYVEALNNVEWIGSEARIQWADSVTVTVPAIKIGQFRFTSGTR